MKTIGEKIKKSYLDNTPYIFDNSAAEHQLAERLDVLEERVSLLRKKGTLTEETIRVYYGEKRFEQIAESNALEGSTLSVGETELAVLKGITITGHDPEYIRDAVSLDKALTRLAEMAKERDNPTDIEQLHELHSLILGTRRGSGIFRNQPVSIGGTQYIPPQTWEKIMNQMEEWQAWSRYNAEIPAPIRAVVLHAWLVHVHPFIDGNGRTARAIANLELIRKGYPPIIIRKKERTRYIEALSESDQGDIRSFIELIFERIDGAIIGLELSAGKMQGYNPVLAKIREMQERQLSIWNTGIKLLTSMIEHQLAALLTNINGRCSIKMFEPIDIDDYTELCNKRSVAKSWAFIITLSAAGMSKLEKLLYVGHRSPYMYNYLGKEGGPSLYWSSENTDGFPKWTADEDESPFCIELTSKNGYGDEWFARISMDRIETFTTSEAALKIADSLLKIFVERGKSL